MAKHRGRSRRRNDAGHTVMEHRFSQVPSVSVPRSQLDRSHGHKTTFDAGYLVPVYVDEILPGDTFNLGMSAFARLATPIHPIMDNIFMESFFFFVPLRLVWNNFEKFMGAQDDPGDSTDYTVPQFTGVRTEVTTGSLFDYLGWPIDDATVTDTYAVNSLHTRAYNLIWNEWFRDENLQDSVHVDYDDGPDTASDYVLLRRGKRHDYFTSCLPWPQKGDAVSLPLGGLAPVVGIGKLNTNFPDSLKEVWETDNTALQTYVDSDAVDGTAFYIEGSAASSALPKIYADLSDASAATINELRQAFQIQRMLEKDARGGTRYTEKIRAHFGVISPDARLQRPEYLGGGSSSVNISPIAQTSETTSASDQANLAAIGTVSTSGHGFVSSFTEHGVIIGMVNIRADLTYQQGLLRMWSRQTREDFYWPALAHIGEQTVLRKEIYTTGVDAADDIVFGYQERYGEYRYKPSQITGLFRSGAAASLDIWHLSQEFGSPPTLDSTFIEDNPPIDRVIADSGEPHFIFDSYFNLRCARPMPVYGVPGLIDHF